MNESGRKSFWMIAVPIVLALASSGCATKKYARQQAETVNQRVSKLEAKTNQEISYLNTQLKTDISRVDERITTTDAKLAEVAGVAQQASASAAQANQTGEANQAKILANATGIEALSTMAENAWNYQLIEKGDVTFAFNKATLDAPAKVALDLVIQKAQAMPRSVVELRGFTDKIGSPSYNLALSRRRAEAVARYLAERDVPLRDIHVIGLGIQDPPKSLTADVEIVPPNASPAEIRRLSRRVYIRVYAPLTSIAGEAARQQQPPK